MPTLVFSDDFAPGERSVYSKIFAQACAGLGIAEADASVLMVKEAFPYRHQKGNVCRLSRDCFRVAVNARNDIFDGTFALSHETVHIKQHLAQQLRDDRHGLWWCGRFFPAAVATSKDLYHDLPWEKEAHALGPRLHEAGLSVLTTSEFVGMIDAAGVTATINQRTGECRVSR